jgi:hypothetical protein
VVADVFKILSFDVVFQYRSLLFETFVHFDLVPLAKLNYFSKIRPVVAEKIVILYFEVVFQCRLSLLKTFVLLGLVSLAKV